MSKERTGLYIMVIITMFASCSNSDDLAHIRNDIHDLQEGKEPIPIVMPAIALPDFCLREYQYPRSDEQARKCFELLVEEIQGYNGEQ